MTSLQLDRWLAIVPVCNLSGVPEGLVLPFYFSANVSLRRIPDWLLSEDNKTVDLLKPKLREIVHDKISRYCFTVEFEADWLTMPDPNWRDAEPRSVQDSAEDQVLLAFLAMWLACPTGACFEDAAFVVDRPSERIVRQLSNYNRMLRPLPEYAQQEHTLKSFETARSIFGVLVGLPRLQTVSMAVRSLGLALSQADWALRFLALWLGLEALFGPDDGGEITHRISQRIAFFLGKDRAEARELFAKVKVSYRWRSKIVHGMRMKNVDPDEPLSRLSELEPILRDSLRTILADERAIATFDGRERERYLDDLLFTGRL